MVTVDGRRGPGTSDEVPGAAADAASDEMPDAATLAAARALAARYDGVDVDAVPALRTLSSTWIARSANVVVKVHAPGTTVRSLGTRLALAAQPALRPCVLAPLVARPLPLGPGGSGPPWATVWPRIEPLPLDVVTAPWAEAGRLLARLHGTPVPVLPAGDGPPPVQGSVARLRAALDRLDAAAPERPARTVPAGLSAALPAVRTAAAGLPAASWSAAGAGRRPHGLVHGDWHLGQLGRLRRDGPDRWRLIDVDDLGVGDPVWDLGRPAAFWAAGLMPDDDWQAFLGAYRDAAGPALPPAPADPWPALDAVAQACVVLAAAGAVRRAIRSGEDLTDVDARMVEICAGLPDSRER